MRDIGKAFRRPPAVRLRDRRRFPKAFGLRRTWATDVPHRRATRVLAESLGQPSLWVIISAPWYKADIGAAPRPASPKTLYSSGFFEKCALL